MKNVKLYEEFIEEGIGDAVKNVAKNVGKKIASSIAKKTGLDKLKSLAKKTSNYDKRYWSRLVRQIENPNEFVDSYIDWPSPLDR